MGFKKKTSAAATEEAAAPAADNTFEYAGKKYKVTKPTVIRFVTGPTELTAADICTSLEAQQYLVEEKCTCIEEVVE